MTELKYPNVKVGAYFLEEDGAIYSVYKKDYMNPTKDKDGYLKINLRKQDGGLISVRIATLVAYTYLGPPQKELQDPTINHKNGNIIDNHYSNLEWIERSKNSSIRFNTGKGSKNSQAKLKEEEVEKICSLLATTSMTCHEIAQKFQVSDSAIYNIYSKKNWKNIVCKYDFSNRHKVKDSSGKFFVVNIREDSGGN